MMHKQILWLQVWLLTTIYLTNISWADDWIQWRGPTADGVASASARPPLSWDANTNISWAAEISGQGSATPVVLGNQVFVVSAEKTARKSPIAIDNDSRAKTVPDEYFYRFLVTSYDRQTGKVLWQKLATEQVPHEGRHETNTYAAGSPNTDGQRLYVSFGSRGLYCYTLSGDLVWQLDLGDMHTRYGWGEAVTPALAKDSLIVNWDHEDDSFIVAIDKLTGQKIWSVARPGEVSSWNTPLVTEWDGKQIAVVNGTGTVKAYDVETGRVLWECGGQTTNAIPSPLRYGDTAICMSGYRDAYACAIPLGSQGNITGASGVRWEYKQGTPYVPSPIISGHRLFFTAGNTDVMSCIDVRTGKSLIDRMRLSGVKSLYASPVLAAGHLYFVGRQGTTVVVKDDATLEIVAVNELDDTLDASPVAVDTQLFLRGWKKLYCLEDKGAANSATGTAN